MKNIHSECSFDSIVVIESLEEGHKTGRKLANEDLYVQGTVNKINISYCPVSNSEEFHDVLYKIDRDIHYGFQQILGKGSSKPILHVEAHGSRNGIQLLSGEIFPWPIFTDWCRRLNRPMLNNLLVVLALCKGFKAIFDVDMTSLTPYWGLIGSEENISDTLAQFSGFYIELFKTGDVQNSMVKLDDSYQLFLCEKIFITTFLKYYVNHCRGQGKQERLERLVTKFREKNPTRDYTEARKILRENLKKAGFSFEQFKNRFLLADLPGNEDRFNFDFELIEDVAEDYFQSHGV
ncbi:MAG: hypothetical protein WDZ80_01550 [Candidatus Paceibacterota bacterium]